MATLQQAIERALAEAARANAEAETTERTLVSDPWYFLDPIEGDQRLRDYLRREQARERKG